MYFQPPSTVKLVYPCIIYSLDAFDTKKANNALYNYTKGYMLTYIDPNPDSAIPELLLQLPMCRFSRHYTADNLNHDVFNVYY